MITFYTAPTPNCYKVSIALEELGLPYEVVRLDLKALDQKQPDFLAINPNGRVPAIVDDGFPVFESGAILWRLAEKAGRLLPDGADARSQALQWLMHQMSGVGPMQGQANVFFRYFPEQIPAAISRYQNETLRLYGVLEARLAERDYILADYSIVDIAFFPWVRDWAWAGLDIEPFPRLAAWIDRIAARPAVQRGMTIPEPPRRSEVKLEAAAAMLQR